MKSSNAAIEDFQKAKRDDLVDNEKVQVAILEEYIKTIDVVREEEVDQAITEAIEKRKADGQPVAQGPLTGAVYAKFSGRALDAQLVADKIKAAL